MESSGYPDDSAPSPTTEACEGDTDDGDSEVIEAWLADVLEGKSSSDAEAVKGDSDRFGWLSSLFWSSEKAACVDTAISDDDDIDLISGECSIVQEHQFGAPQLGCSTMRESASEECYSFLLQGPLKKNGGGRALCSKELLSGCTSKSCTSLSQLLNDFLYVDCRGCGSPLRQHRASFLRKKRRVLLEFQPGTAATLLCGCCDCSWQLPLPKLLALQGLAFLKTLWAGCKKLPCEHAFEHGKWLVAGSVFTIMPTEPTKLELRGPALFRMPTPPVHLPDFTSKCLSAAATVEGLLEASLKRLLAEMRVAQGQGHARGGRLSRKDFEFSRRCQDILEAKKRLHNCIANFQEVLEEPQHEAIQIGSTCAVSVCLASCRKLICNARPKLEPPEPSLKDPIEKQSTGVVKAKLTKLGGRARSAPPRLFQSSTTRSQFAMSSTNKYQLDDLSLGLALGRSWWTTLFGSPALSTPHPVSDSRGASPRTNRWRAASSSKLDMMPDVDESPDLPVDLHKRSTRLADMASAGRSRSKTITPGKRDEELLLQALSSQEDEDAVLEELCNVPRRALEAAGVHVGPNENLCVAEGVHGVGIPLPCIRDGSAAGSEAATEKGIGAIIAHALVSKDCWRQLRPSLLDSCLWVSKAPSCRERSLSFDLRCHCFASLAGDDGREIFGPNVHPSVEHDPTIAVTVGSGSVSWNVEIIRPVGFHLLRHLEFGDDLVFCDMLRRSSPVITKGGKSSAGFWRSPAGDLILKEIKSGEARAISDAVAKRLVDHYLGVAADKSFHSALSDIFGVFKISSAGLPGRTIIIMRNIQYGCNASPDDHSGPCEFYDIKGLGEHRRFKAKPSAEEPGSPSPSAEAPDATPEVNWDSGFVTDLGGLPLSLRPQDHATLLDALSKDTSVLEELGLVDYSMFVALWRPHHGLATGFPGSDGGGVRLGIIDYLQPYSLEKKIESKVKQLVRGSDATTIIEPSLYRRRFCNFFLSRAFEPAPGAGH